MNRSLLAALSLAGALGATGCSGASPGMMFESSSSEGRDNLDSGASARLNPSGDTYLDSSLGFAAGAGVDAPNTVLDDFGVPEGQDSASTSAPSKRLMMHTGQLDLAVGDPEAAGRRAAQIAEELGGYVQSQTDTRLGLRIPADRWEDGVAALSALGRVLARDLRVQDVTEEHVDVQLQLKNLRQLSDRLSELLARAESVSEALEVETQLARVRGQIERLQGRLNFLNDRIAMATLTLQLHRVSDSRSPRRLPFQWLQELGVERLLSLPGASR